MFTTHAVTQYLAEDSGARAGHPAADPQRTWNAILSLRKAGLMTIDPPGPPPAVRISPVIQAVIRAAVPDNVYDRAALAAAALNGCPRPAACSQSRACHALLSGSRK